MDRYHQVKLLLKGWEQSFTTEHHRKPNKEDIDRAPEETRSLYREYSSLKQAKERSGSGSGSGSSSSSGGGGGGGAAAGGQAAAEPSAASKDSWGAHLNRSALPASSPKLTAQDGGKPEASSQYYGLKLKRNLASLSKERPVSLRKSLAGRRPSNSWKDEGRPSASSPAGPAQTTADPGTKPFSPRRIGPTLESFTSPTLRPAQPETLCEPLEPSRGFSEAPVDSVRSCNAASAPQSALLSSLSPERTEGRSGGDEDAVGGASGYNAGSPDSPDAPQSAPSSAGASLGSKGSPRFPGGLRGGAVGRPSPGSRLSFVDRKWLERCQVFGEMAEEEKPGAGNHSIRVEKSGQEREEDTKGGKRGRRADAGDEPEEQATPGSGRDEKFPNAGEARDGKTNCDQQGAEKGRGRRNGEDSGGGHESPGDEKQSKKKRGTKRQREGEQSGGETAEEGAKKRRRRVKAKDDTSPVKKRRSKKRADEGESEEDKEPRKQQKAPQENLLGEVEQDFASSRMYGSQPVRARVSKAAEGNYVRINLKKKSHVKGYALRGMALRRQMYMQKFQLKGERFGGGGGGFGRGRRGGFRGGLSRQGDTCYKCGGTGHWAIDCKGRAPPPPVSEDQPADLEPFELPTLEDVARATGTLRPEPPVSSLGGKEPLQLQDAAADGSSRDEAPLDVIRPDYRRPAAPPPMEPLYPLTEDAKVQETPDEVHAALRALGYPSFRAGQEEAIMRVLSGLSTLVVLSTGMGKSLCYQLPAYLYAKRSKCITLVVSPLVSLMDDQLSGVPVQLKAACIHSNMTMKQREAAIAKVKSGDVCVLLLSPEALVGGGGSGSGCLPSAQELPPVAFACIDEAHCVSEWSHNFRPCYLRLCKVLRERLGVRCMLGLTATATLSTALDIARHLEISGRDGIAVRSAAVPPNLRLSVSTDRDKDQALVSLLKGERFGCLDSIIVYCTRREETTRVAALLRTCLQGVLVKENHQLGSSSQSQSNPAGQKKKDLARKKIRKPLKWQAESYHAGLSGSERRRVQNNFMCGQLRIVVATVAFGMGLDKPDVRGIVHFNMPKSFESYVQEIGRAGRDGEPAHCHLFLDPEGGDLHELRRHIYADTVDFFTIKRLVQKVFPACKCKQIQQKQQQQQQQLSKEVEDCELLEMMDVCDEDVSPPQQDELREPTAETPARDSAQRLLQGGKTDGKSEEEQTQHAEADWREEQPQGCDWPQERVCHTHERAVPIQETVEALDITEEGIETLLCYLELHPQRFVELLHPITSLCKVRCSGGPRQLRKITRICPPVAVVLARRRMAGERVEACDEVDFDVVELADTMGWELPLVKRGLRQLQWSTDAAGGRSGVLVDFSCPSFYFRSYGDLSADEMDAVCQFLHSRVQDQERTQLYQLAACFQAFRSVAFQTASSCLEDLDETRSSQLKQLLSDYFDKRRDGDHSLPAGGGQELDKLKLLEWEDQIRADIRSFLANRSDEKFSGRAVARILHGIGSPRYPALTYGRDRRYWRKYIQFDFNQLIRLATQEIVRFK